MSTRCAGVSGCMERESHSFLAGASNEAHIDVDVDVGSGGDVGGLMQKMIALWLNAPGGAPAEDAPRRADSPAHDTTKCTRRPWLLLGAVHRVVRQRS